MARPIWSGTLSFGLLNVPIRLMSGERHNDLHFRLLDQRDNKPIRYERVNAESGEEVPWKEIVKAFEYRKGSYVVLEESDIRGAASEAHEVVEIDTFIDAGEIGPSYFEKPYILVPAKKAEKGYVLLRETLKKTNRVGIARVVIRTREYLAAVMAQDNALIMNLLRYPADIIDPEDYGLPEKSAKDYRITPKEMEMAKSLIDSMAGTWKPSDYRDEFREKLRKVIEKRLAKKGVTADIEEEHEAPEDATTNVVDFMALLKKSIAGNKRTPAARRGGKAASKSTAKAAKSAGKKAAAKKATRKVVAKKTAKGASAKRARA
jgi:DNA end-binding protein Ku